MPFGIGIGSRSHTVAAMPDPSIEFYNPGDPGAVQAVESIRHRMRPETR